MSKGFGGIVEAVMSIFVEVGGKSVSRGGGGLLLGAARKIGWASSQGGSSGRIAGHRLGGHKMGMGFGGSRGLTNYDPKTHHQNMQAAYYSRGSRSGSGLLKPPSKDSRPTNLFGRSTFQGADTLSGDPKTRWVRQGQGGGGSYSPAPRSFIRFNK